MAIDGTGSLVLPGINPGIKFRYEMVSSSRAVWVPSADEGNISNDMNVMDNLIGAVAKLELYAGMGILGQGKHIGIAMELDMAIAAGVRPAMREVAEALPDLLKRLDIIRASLANTLEIAKNVVAVDALLGAAPGAPR